MCPIEKYISTSRKPTDHRSLRSQLRRLVVLELLFGGGGTLRPAARALERRTVARVLHGCDDLLRRGGSLHAHRVRQQAHRAGRDARHLRYRLFHTGASRRRSSCPLRCTAPCVHFLAISSASAAWRPVRRSPRPCRRRMSCATQVRMWLASSSLLKALTAALTAADWIRMSGQ